MKTILITGAASGIGAAIAYRLASPETNLILHSRKNVTGLESVADIAKDKGSNVSTFLNDLHDETASEELIEHTVTTFKSLDQIVSNAGYAIRGQFGDISAEDLRLSHLSMPEAFFKLVNKAIPYLMSSHSGRVLVVSSFVAHVFDDESLFPITAAAKASLEALSKSLAAQVAAKGITVNCIAPGYTQKDGPHSAISEDAWKRAEAKIPMGRIGTPDDTAALAEFLLSEDARFITGQTIHVDGGLTLR
ncbi:MAG: short-chain dehydrogenase [Dehalococcoidia bacterium]|nr:short-chain dehydrogenase [Dehalococcoidia bacterium]|tara:strand:+ start:931 stop:1674 length:744 start_codon:yes stop_codon:yes gene_type:complete